MYYQDVFKALNKNKVKYAVAGASSFKAARSDRY